MMFWKVIFDETMVTFFDSGSTYEVSKTCEVSFPPIRDMSHFGALCLQVMSRSVRSYAVLVSVRWLLRVRRVAYNSSFWIYMPR